MNRQLKFRAWYEIKQRPKYNCMLFVGDDKGTTHNLDCCKYLMEGQPVTLMQYTGLKDKNGQEIYEGDIVTLNVLSEYERGKGNYYISKMFTVTYANQEFLPYRLDESTVIGNIFENPELLGK